MLVGGEADHLLVLASISGEQFVFMVNVTSKEIDMLFA